GLAPEVRRAAAVRAGETTDVDVALGDGFTLSGRVTDAVTGAPIERARVRLGTGPSNGVEADTDADGRYRIEHFPGEARRWIAITAMAAGYATTSDLAGFVDDAKPADELDLALVRPAALRLRCVDAAGAPMRGALVAVSSNYVTCRPGAMRCTLRDSA